jgi:replicative DNA helicase
VIHETAIIEGDVQLGEGAQVGWYSIVRGKVRAGRNLRLGSHSSIEGDVTIGDDVTIRGKALALATPILTTDGWSTIGSVRTGQHVFGVDGRPTRIIATTAAMFDRDCYEVEFSDGAQIVADAEHLWAVETNDRHFRELAKVGGRRRQAQKFERTSRLEMTWQLAERLKASSRPPRVAFPKAIMQPEASLPVAPYLLGLWLGDGTHRAGTITMADDDARWVAAILRRGGESVRLTRWKAGALVIGVHARPDLCAYGHVRLGRWNRCRECAAARRDGRDRGERWNVSLSERLRDLGILHPAPKRIPLRYLEASAEQRRELLRGLVDSDGSVDGTGRVEISSILPDLVEDITALLASLGTSARTYGKRLPPSKRGADRAWRIAFFLSEPPARLPRKRHRWLPPGDQASCRYLRAVRACPSVPVRCISVAAADGLFLAGHALVPTHNCEIPNSIIGNRVSIYSGCKFYDTPCPPDGPNLPPVIEDDVTICCDAAILGGVTIGAGSFIGARVFVTADVPPCSRVTVESDYRVRPL